jgi:hypothetical protein
MERHGFFNNIPQDKTLEFAKDIARIGYHYDCNNGEIFNEIGKRLNFCYACNKFSTEIDEDGLCKECR